MNGEVAKKGACQYIRAMQNSSSLFLSNVRTFVMFLAVFFFLFLPVQALSKVSGQETVSLKGLVTMGQAVRFALQANPDLAAQAAQTRASEEGRKSARGEFGPKLGMTYSAMKQERKSEPTSTPRPEKGTYTLGLEISQPVFQGFRLLANYQKAALQAQSDKLALRKARLEKIEAVQTAFIGYLRAEANVQSQREAMERLSDQLSITQAYYATGLKPKLDVLQAEVDLREAESVLLQIENNQAIQQSRLNTLLGLAATSSIRYQGKLLYRPFPFSLEQCLEVAYRKRPDLIMAALAVDIAGKDRKAVQAGYYPKIEAYYNVTGSGNTPDLQMSGEHGSRYTSWEVGAKATWDVFQWGTTYYADQRAGELVQKMRYEERSLRLDVGHDLKSKFLTLREAEKRILVARANVASADEAYRAAMARYREQAGTGFDVLDTSSKLTTAKFSLTSAYADYLTAVAQLFVAMGEEHPDVMRL